MNKNPFFHALYAALYIMFVSSVMTFLPKGPDEDTILAPIVVLSLFVLSAAVMGYLFLGKPLQMYLDGQKKEAVNFFFKTVGSFAVFTALFYAALYFFGVTMMGA